MLFAFLAGSACYSLALGEDQSFKDWNGSWTRSVTGGSSIEIPSFLSDGPAHGDVQGDVDYGTVYDGVAGLSLLLQQYRVRPSTERPYVFLTEATAGLLQEVTYSVDKDTLGVVSGYEGKDHKQSYYGICRPRPAELHCVAMFWDAADQSVVEPMIERIVRSFKQ